MTSLRLSLALAGAAALLPAVAEAAPLDRLYERSLMVAADDRCGLFEPAVRAPLRAFQVQARGAARRAGAEATTIAATEARARAKAASAGCASPDIATAAARVRSAFAGYARLIRMTFPGDIASWTADRSSSREALRWRLSQGARFGRDELIFGLAGRRGADALVALAWFDDGAAPYAARLVLRDRRLVARPYLSGPTLPRRLPPSGLKAFLAEARSAAGRDLRPEKVAAGWAFRFPAAAAAEMAELDPREAVAVEFLMPGDRVRRAYIEVGDFAAGRAFLGEP